MKEMFLFFVFLFLGISNGKEITVKKCEVESFSKKMPSIGPNLGNRCYLCSKSVCDFSNGKQESCDLMSTMGPLPFYSNFIQGAFIDYGAYLFVAEVSYAKGCVIQMRINVKEMDGPQVEFYSCIEVKPMHKNPSLTNSNCFKLKDKSITLTRSELILFTLKIHQNTLIVSFQTEGEYFNIDKEKQTEIPLECSSLKKTPKVHYKFYHLQQCSNQECVVKEGAALLVPCSSGGFLIDPLTGKLAQGEYLKNLTGMTDNSELAKELSIDPEELFPFNIDPNSLKPIYINNQGHAKSPKTLKDIMDMMPKDFDVDGFKKQLVQLEENEIQLDADSAARRERAALDFDLEGRKGDSKNINLKGSVKNIFNFLFFDRPKGAKQG